MPNSTATSDEAGRRRGTLLLGVSLLLFAAAALWFARDIGRVGIRGNNDPGPHFFPVLLATALLIFGLMLIGVGLLARPQHPWVTAEAREDETQTGLHARRWLILIGVLTLYIVSIPWLGFSLSTFAVAAGLMIWLGNRWWLALIVSAVMVTVVKLLFVILFRVQLPVGQLGLPF